MLDLLLWASFLFCRARDVFDRFESLHATVRLKIARGDGVWSNAGLLLVHFKLLSILTKTRIKLVGR